MCVDVCACVGVCAVCVCVRFEKAPHGPAVKTLFCLYAARARAACDQDAWTHREEEAPRVCWGGGGVYMKARAENTLVMQKCMQ